MQNTAFSTNKTLNLNGRILVLDAPKIMAVLNVTPDSFYRGSRIDSDAALLKQTEKYLSEGAAILDVGGYSSRPKATDIPFEDERSRIVNAIRLIVRNFPEANISIDTFRSEIARIAVSEGAAMVNDVSGGTLDEKMFATVAELQKPYVLMHMRGTPQTMTTLTHYTNVTKDVLDDLEKKVSALNTLGVKDIVIDPGFGFAKTRDQNFRMLAELELFSIIGRPVMVGLSRKSLIWKTLDVTAEEALNGTTALHTIALVKGADIVRCHDVKECVEVITLVQELKKNSPAGI